MTSTRSVIFANPVRTAIGTFGGTLKNTPALIVALLQSAPRSNVPGCNRAKSARLSWATWCRPAPR